MASNKDTVVRIDGMRQLLRVLNKIPKDLQNDVRDASTQIATDLVGGAKRAAHTPLQNLAAAGLKAKRDRVPTVRVGQNVVRPGVRESDIFYGAEFGGGARPTTRQFLPHRGQRGYFFYPTARQRGEHYFHIWSDAVDSAFAQWDYRGGGLSG